MNVDPFAPTLMAPGFVLDGYELLSRVGQGGMASVWVARRFRPGGFERLFAVKTILPALAGDPRLERVLLTEARIVSRIHHPNVVPVLDVGEEGGVVYIVLEWVEGGSLHALHQAAIEAGQPLPPAMLLAIAADVCAGLHSAHELQDEDGRPLHLVHRDVSPQNVLVSVEGAVKLIDFGIAKVRWPGIHQTSPGVVKGTLGYLAPEQAAGRAVDRRADVWAVGAVLYHLLGGRPPYPGRSMLETIQRTAFGPPPPPLPHTLPASVRAVVQRALSRNPDERFPTALALKHALEATITELGRPPTSADVAERVRTLLGPSIDERRRRIADAQRASERSGVGSRRPLDSDAAVAVPVRVLDDDAVTLRTEAPKRAFDARTLVAAVARRRPRALTRFGLAVTTLLLVTVAALRGPEPRGLPASPPSSPLPIDVNASAPEPPSTTLDGDETAFPAAANATTEVAGREAAREPSTATHRELEASSREGSGTRDVSPAASAIGTPTDGAPVAQPPAPRPPRSSDGVDDGF